jgi:hypothetical protein
MRMRRAAARDQPRGVPWGAPWIRRVARARWERPKIIAVVRRTSTRAPEIALTRGAQVGALVDLSTSLGHPVEVTRGRGPASGTQQRPLPPARSLSERDGSCGAREAQGPPGT